MPPSKGRNGKLETTSKGKAQILNDQYCGVFIDEDLGGMPDLGESPYPGMANIRVSVNGVTKLLKVNKAIGPDIVPTRLLRDFADDIAQILRMIFQQSLDLIIVYLQSYNSMFSKLNAYNGCGKPSALFFPWHLYASVTWITITYENDLLPTRHQAIVILKCWCVHKPITKHMLEISHNWIYSELYCLWWHHHLVKRKAVLYDRKEI